MSRPPGPEHTNLDAFASSGETAEAELAGRFADLKVRVAAVRADPEPEAIHQIRVSARRLYAALKVFRPLIVFPSPARWRSLRRVERRFGQLRDLDILQARLSAEPSGDPLLTESAERLQRDLAAERTEVRQRAVGSLRDRRYRLFRRRLSSWLARPRITVLGQLSLAAAAPDLLLPALSATLLHSGWFVEQIPAPDDPDAQPLHSLRRQIKTLRYQTECLHDWYGESVITWLDELHRMQDALGAWHDEGLLMSALERLAAPAGLTAAARTRSAAVLDPWPEWRARYLDPKFRASLRGLLGLGGPRGPHAPKAGVPRGAATRQHSSP